MPPQGPIAPDSISSLGREVFSESDIGAGPDSITSRIPVASDSMSVLPSCCWKVLSKSDIGARTTGEGETCNSWGYSDTRGGNIGR
ncbi:unnamed protein product [Arabis nemorensis]|uniref:Uncharacterized protein n=1 Tax=Arabis nemorensis TaxID=586526 RepID=A0A565CE89_9BRAS|nr:unnamed protein product [Arabis nemorensis]